LLQSEQAKKYVNIYKERK